MKICNWTEFAALPEGAIFSYYEPCICRGLFRKGETIHRDTGEPFDFWETELLPSQMHPDDPLRLEDIKGRWGSYSYEQLFAVYEPADIDLLVSLLRAS